jgi:hypothetical protein
VRSFSAGAAVPARTVKGKIRPSNHPGGTLGPAVIEIAEGDPVPDAGAHSSDDRGRKSGRIDRVNLILQICQALRSIPHSFARPDDEQASAPAGSVLLA